MLGTGVYAVCITGTRPIYTYTRNKRQLLPPTNPVLLLCTFAVHSNRKNGVASILCYPIFDLTEKLILDLGLFCVTYILFETLSISQPINQSSFFIVTLP